MIHYILSITIWSPILAGILVLFAGKNDSLARAISLIGALFAFIVSLFLFIDFNSSTAALQFTEFMPWISSLNINYALGIDGISMPLVILNNFITLLVIIASFRVIHYKVALYNSMFLIMTGVISGAFCATDAMLFYVFFEAMLIPMYLIIGVWGASNRVYAAIKFFLYTLLGSLLMLVGLIYLYLLSGKNFDLFAYYRLKIALLPQILLFIAFFFAFAVKVPMWPVHTWLPDAHPEAPTGGSMVLAAITLKLGGYGFFRFMLPIVPDASRYLANFMITLSLVAIIYISLVAIVQKDMKKLVAYSSIAHMGFVTLGTFLFTGYVLNTWAMQGAIVQMVSHGFISAAMFMCIGVMYERIHSRNIADYGGVASKMPIFAAFFMLFAMANSGLPGTSGFVGEFMVIMGAIQTKLIYGVLAGTTLVLGAAYNLWMYKRVIFGKVTSHHVSQMKDVDIYEFLVLAALAAMVLLFGLYPQLLVSKIEPSVNNLIAIVASSKLY